MNNINPVIKILARIVVYFKNRRKLRFQILYSFLTILVISGLVYWYFTYILPKDNGAKAARKYCLRVQIERNGYLYRLKSISKNIDKGKVHKYEEAKGIIDTVGGLIYGIYATEGILFVESREGLIPSINYSKRMPIFVEGFHEEYAKHEQELENLKNKINDESFLIGEKLSPILYHNSHE